MLQRLASHALASTRPAVLGHCAEQAATSSSFYTTRSLSTSLARLAQQAWAEDAFLDDIRTAVPGSEGDKTLQERQEELVHFLHMAGQQTKRMWPKDTKFEHCVHKPWSRVCDYMRTTLTSPSMLELWQRQLRNEINFTKELAEDVQRDRAKLASVGRITTTTDARQLIARWTGPLQESLRKEIGEILAGKPGLDRSVYGKYLCAMDPEQLAVLTITGTLNVLFNKTSDYEAPAGDPSWNFRPGHRPGEAKIVVLATHLGRLVQVQSHLNIIEEDIQRHQRGRAEYRRGYQQMRALWHGIERKEPHWPEPLKEPGIVQDPAMHELLSRVWAHEEPLALPRVADLLIAITENRRGGEEVVAAAYRTVGRMIRRMHAYESRAYWAENSLQESRRGGVEPHQSIEQRGQQQLSSILHMKQTVQREIDAAVAHYKGNDAQLQDAAFLFWDLRRYMHQLRMQLLRDAMQGVEATEQQHWAKTVDELFSDTYATRLETRLAYNSAAVKEARRKVVTLAKSPSVRQAMMDMRLDRKRRRKQQDAWTPEVMAKVGAVLLKHLVDTAKVKIPVPGLKPGPGHIFPPMATVCAFSHGVVWLPQKRGGKPRPMGVFRTHDGVVDVLTKFPGIPHVYLDSQLPMIIKPFPWTSVRAGGYFTNDLPVMRTRGDQQQLKRLLEADQLTKVYDALNALGDTGWRINGFVLDVVDALWDNGKKGGVADLPMPHNNTVLEPVQAHFRLAPTGKGQLSVGWLDETRIERRQRMAAQALIRKHNNEMHSLRSDTEHKLSIARRFRDDVIYYPHTLDFRGRAYPMHPHLNHMGNDLCRGLLTFAQPRPLGERGWHWLLVHLYNLHDGGKRSIGDRAQWSLDHLPQVLAVAQDPLGQREPEGLWWMQGESPFQSLAVCREIAEIVTTLQPEDYHMYESRQPVYQDGSCNGLQHYAALGRDFTGGKAVNLVPGPMPADVYSEIARVVKRRVEADALDNNPLALVLRNDVDRKLVKQTVMTSVYGVTPIGAAQQVVSRLVERGWPDNGFTYRVARYGANTTLAALEETFGTAKTIMNWLSECAGRISEQDKVVEWTTPLGLPVMQPYRRKYDKSVRTVLQHITLTFPGKTDNNVIKSRQRSAFAPNYVHSLDSSHMMKTAIACKQQGVTFAGVHDSYWTHAGTVDDMNRILREQFVDLHSRPLLQNLLDEFRANPEYVEALPKPRRRKPPKPSAAADDGPVGTFTMMSASDDALVDGQGAAGGEGLMQGVLPDPAPTPRPIDFPDVPPVGDLDINVVKDSTYFFA